ncbi:MAG TPA: peptide-N4-asparagine amidase [Streptosporangiaceae bacterium]|nr:peptide-N4-asparagine amidase [Streptosporangiaceae bacterium]
MRARLRQRRRWLAGLAAVLTAFALGGAVTAAAASLAAGAHPRRIAPPVIRAGGAHGVVRASAHGQASESGDSASPSEFSTTANPITLDAPVAVPPTRPVVVTVASDAAFGNGPPPFTSTVTLPQGNWAEVVLDVTGTESGTQYDRLCEVFDGASEIFLGVTPEPTPAGISWHVQKDITGYLPILSGTQTFSTYVDNYLSSTDNGIPTITVKLLFYPAGGGFQPARPATIGSPALAGDAINETGPASPAQRPAVPTQVIPVVPAGATSTLNTINTGQTLTASVTLPDNVTTASFDLYAVGQIDDEFWWAEEPAFREIEVSIDGRPAGVVWPYPYVYTGGVNPLIWRPLTGIHTMDIPSYRLDLTPFAGELGGTHTISLTVVNNAGYWLAGGSLLITAGGGATTGTVSTDTLSFPTTSQVTTVDGLGSPDNPVTTETAAASYQISGQVTQGGQTWTDTVRQSLQFGDDQTTTDAACTTECYQWVHGEETQTSAQTVTGPGATYASSDKSSWTIDAPNGYIQNASGTDFLLPAAVNQQLTDFAAENGWQSGSYQTTLSESIIGYGSLEEDGSTVPVADGDTTGTITQQALGYGYGSSYLRTVVTHGGVIVQDLEQGGTG